jgi:hypothetical protein
MASDMYDFLVERYGAREWLEPEAVEESVFVWRLSPEAAAIEGMEPLRVQQVEVAPETAQSPAIAGALESQQASPMRVTESIWTPSPDQPRRLVHLRTFECDSRAAARAQLLSVLADMQGPVTERKDIAGEISFATPNNTTILAARGNLVFTLTNAGQDVIDLAGVATALDRKLAEAPPSPESMAESSSLPDDDTPFKAIARGGEVVVENGRPVLRGKNVTVVRLP